MTPVATFFLFSSLSLLFVARAQDRAPHGLVYENPVAFSPSAVEFFHPKTQEPDTKARCAEPSSCSPLPLATQVEATQVHESKISTSQKGGSGLSTSGIAGIVFGLAFAAFLAMGAYYVLIKRRANVSQTNSVEPDA